MRKNSWIALAAVTVLVVIAAVYVVMQRNAETDRGQTSAAYVIPGLLAKVNDVATIAVHDAKHKFTVVRQKDETWTIPELSGYPAKLDAVKKAVVGMAELKALEPRTSRPELYSKISVDDPDKPKSEAVQVDLKDAAGKEIAGLIIGKTKSYEGDVRPAQIYVRRVGEKQSWLAEGRLEVKPKPIGWVQEQVLDLPRERMMSVEIDQPEGTKLVISRPDRDAKDFTLQELASGMKPKASEIDGVATGLESLVFDDVVKADTLDFSKAPVATFRTFDGLVITTRTLVKDKKHWVTFAASYDAAQAAKDQAASKKADEAKAAKADAGKEAKSAKEDKPAAGTDKAKADAKVADAKTAPAKPSVEAEAEKLEAGLSGWAYQITDYRAENFTRKPADLMMAEKEKKKGS